MRKIEISARLPFRIGLSESEAAASLSLSASFFRKLVQEGLMPKPRLIMGRRVYDADELAIAFREWPREGDDGATVDTWSDF
jgi:hypothetical protein